MHTSLCWIDLQNIQSSFFVGWFFVRLAVHFVVRHLNWCIHYHTYKRQGIKKNDWMIVIRCVDIRNNWSWWGKRLIESILFESRKVFFGVLMYNHLCNVLRFVWTWIIQSFCSIISDAVYWWHEFFGFTFCGHQFFANSFHVFVCKYKIRIKSTFISLLFEKNVSLQRLFMQMNKAASSIWYVKFLNSKLIHLNSKIVSIKN